MWRVLGQRRRIGLCRDQHGTVTANGNNSITFHYAAQGNRAAYDESWIIAGWFVGQDMVVMSLQGPFRAAITQQDFANVQGNSYRNRNYARRR